ncbi:MAG: MjaI family restriction endonuclease [bacterium]
MKTKLKLSNQEIKELLGAKSFDFPKYATQIINLANQNAQGTRPAVVGQMSELIQQFSGKKIEEWEKWYLEQHPAAIQNATEKIAQMIENFRSVMNQIDKQMVENWVRDLVIVKTFIGLQFHEAILIKLSNLLKTTYRLASPKEESKGIDGYLGDVAISIKPETYKSKKGLQEKIEGKLLYYKKVKGGVTIDISGLSERLNK